jgi:DNA-directed RNA polymerase subunit RPC12/RpoP
MRPKCVKCQSKFVYILKDGTVVCRACGHREKPMEVGLGV